MSWNVNIKKKYLVASSTMVLRRIETPSPASFDRGTMNKVNEKAKKSKVSVLSVNG